MCFMLETEWSLYMFQKRWSYNFNTQCGRVISTKDYGCVLNKTECGLLLCRREIARVIFRQSVVVL